MHLYDQEKMKLMMEKLIKKLRDEEKYLKGQLEELGRQEEELLGEDKELDEKFAEIAQSSAVSAILIF